MKTIYVWLFLCQLPLIQSCLIARSVQCKCPYRILNDKNLQKSGDDCSLTIQCEKGYELVVIDLILGIKEFGKRSVDAICNAGAWEVSDGGGSTRIINLYVFCRPITEDCGPNDESSLIFAYSNVLGMNSSIAPKWFESMTALSIDPSVTEFGSIRFNSPIEEDVQVHSSFVETMNSISANLKSPLSGTRLNGVHDALMKILSTRKLQICGATIVAYVHNQAASINPVILPPYMRARHISLYSREPVLNTPLSYSAAKTYGYGIYANLAETADVSYN
uniref:Fibrinogen C-terminal domain-containing protein n=1 Tax=Caenorhabditis tropicalis TaxID=1561998 RepID=A0A1I7TTT9_9PELO